MPSNSMIMFNSEHKIREIKIVSKMFSYTDLDINVKRGQYLS
jgi:hypothetical protein